MIPSRASLRLRVRPALNRDGDALAALIAGVFAEYPGCVFDRGREFPELDAIADDFARASGRIWVTEHESGALLGCLGIKYDGAAREGELHKVYVARETRGLGIARRMMAKALAWLAETHPECKTVMLWTDTRFVAGQRFYEKCGFTRTGQTRILDDLSQSSEYQFRIDFAAYARALAF